MISSMRENYEKLKENPEMLVDYNAILAFYPDYYKLKMDLMYEKFLAKRRVDNIFRKNYKKSELYKNLKNEGFTEEEVFEYMLNNKDKKYDYLELVFNELLKSINDLCDLIDYIGHYPNTYPSPLESEKNPEMEKLLEKYNISVKYDFEEDSDEMQIRAFDIVRIIEKLDDSLNLFNQLKHLFAQENFIDDWFCQKSVVDEKTQALLINISDRIEYFPTLNSQTQGKSKCLDKNI